MIRIIFTASHNIGGRLIRWFTKGRTSHVMIQYNSRDWGEPWIVEAMALGFGLPRLVILVIM